jgi:prepilin-type N-terminal cleavage/methylation domain-containing protein
MLRPPRIGGRTRGFTLIEIMIVVAIIGIVLALAIPNFLKSRVAARKNICIENLSQIETAKQTWGLENSKKSGDVPNMDDLIGEDKYIKRMPACPGGGTYELNGVGTPATCTQEGHVF